MENVIKAIDEKLKEKDETIALRDYQIAELRKLLTDAEAEIKSLRAERGEANAVV